MTGVLDANDADEVSAALGPRPRTIVRRLRDDLQALDPAEFREAWGID